MLRFLTIFAVLITGCAYEAHDWIVVPGLRVGPITASSSIDDLRKAFGGSAVVNKDIDIGEGMTEPGTDIYEKIPGKRLAVLWKDKKPTKVIICYQLLQGDCAWRTADGIGFNTSLKELERQNGRAFKLLGFGWDYSGTVFDWEGGNLKALAKGLIIRLTPDETGNSSEEYQTLLGEGQFSSSLPAMKKLNPKVYAMEMEFPQ
jgi:hypothetical protein